MSSKADPPAEPIAPATAAHAPRQPEHGPRYVPISIIVTTYNRPDALETVLRALARQSDRDFEVIVADDGSTPDTAALLKSWQGRLPQPLTHIWQEHRGFRAAEIRNRAILASSGAYCIFLDGDCIPRRRLRAGASATRRVGWFVVGNRVLMSKHLTDRVLSQNLEPELWTLCSTPVARASMATSIGLRRCCRRGSDRCERFVRNIGGARDRAIWRSGAQTSIGWMDSTPAMSAGGSRIPIC